MRYFLLVFDRVRGALLAEQEYDDPDRALTARFDIERAGAWEGTPLTRDIEVVVLGAASPETLRSTHSRYFMSAVQIARAAAL
ncbi:hypothetical protein [Paractinoplanes durhamensis]|uniref:YCII-related domain-containing protein n=1 Tax=Paractinoplanes durhamensis TaxID=113563 RepID=A0ABQ3ZBX8_9ACTN|nr:hypothetical protein [Actinoplanes durhamensis]GIE07331.1 hypothetical protein Adu01nite_86810 [Actinoplanes durhamensis]